MTLLTTRRITLRPFSEKDIQDALASLNTPEVRQYLGGVKENSAAYDSFAEVTKDKISWSIRSNESNDFIGMMVLDQYHEGHHTELSYLLAKEHWGYGYAQEAIQLIINYAKENLILDSLIAETQSANLSSIRLLERLGFNKKHEVLRFNHIQSVYELPLNDYITYIRDRIGETAINLSGVNAVITNEKHQILLQKRGEYPLKWGLIGGIVELGESLEAACLRETYEETGLKITASPKLFGTTSGKDCYMHLPNGHKAYFITAGFHLHYNNEDLTVNGTETKELKFFDSYDLPSEIVDSHKRMIEIYLNQN
jgi:RimJ/RimL family protein N-acetyltransferase/ADP-ribose pyrophosphatase YjhB (NUDIX family)